MDDGRWTMDDGRWTMPIAVNGPRSSVTGQRPWSTQRAASLVMAQNRPIEAEHRALGREVGHGGARKPPRAHQPPAEQPAQRHVHRLDPVRQTRPARGVEVYCCGAIYEER